MSEKITSLKDALLRIEELEKQLKVFTESDYVDAYMALWHYTSNANKQIIENPIDFFADKDQKESERSHKYLTEMRPYYEQMDYLRKLMSPEQIKEVEKRVGEQKLKRRVGMAENIAMNGNK